MQSENRANQARNLITASRGPNDNTINGDTAVFSILVHRCTSDAAVGFYLIRVYDTLKHAMTNERRLQLITVLRSWVNNTDDSSTSGASAVSVNPPMVNDVKALCVRILDELKNDEQSQRIEGLQHTIETCVVKIVEDMAKEMTVNNQATDTHFKLIQGSISALESALCTAIAESKEHTQQCMAGLESSIAESKEHTQQCMAGLESSIAESKTISEHRFNNLQTAIDENHTQDIEIATKLGMVGTVGAVVMWILPPAAAPVVLIGSFVGLVGVLKRNR